MESLTNKRQQCRTALNMCLMLGVLMTLTACAGNSASTSNSTVAKTTNNANKFKIIFNWDPAMKKCFSNTSPAIQLMNVPAGTTSLSVVMIDEDAPSFDHGGGKVSYTGNSSIPAGALKRWKGPCPPFKHKYTFKITALGDTKAKYSQHFPK